MFLPLRRSTLLAVTGICAGAVLLASCGSGGSAERSAAQSGKLDVVAAFYPLRFAAEKVAGDRATVTNLTKPGGEPHDLELTPKNVAEVEQASLVIYLKGFQPAVDDAVAQAGADHSLEVSGSANLSLTAAGHGDEHGHEHPESQTSGEQTNPHFWLDPLRLAKVGDAIAQRLASIDPEHAETYKANATKLRTQLEGLDKEFRTGLATCQNRELVTNHEAFGYLAARYDFHEVGIAGLSPEQEPSPAQLGRIATFVREHRVNTIYYETLVSPTIANTLAKETGVKVAVLDPIEGLSDKSAGSDYLSIMRANLATLQKGQACS
ncbi:metal ABC transporter substrate-binding protein [Actinopolymorpha alba]|uniref:metal ABC transporter substrate-binding protein n=1 Tax=Actinopolymorpha alba TaxID=533267 RepID=UPI00035F6D01|nr:metal ABC transporter substrate-binding protein [Actinopolymorpha alba]